MLEQKKGQFWNLLNILHNAIERDCDISGQNIFIAGQRSKIFFFGKIIAELFENLPSSEK